MDIDRDPSIEVDARRGVERERIISMGDKGRALCVGVGLVERWTLRETEAGGLIGPFLASVPKLNKPALPVLLATRYTDLHTL